MDTRREPPLCVTGQEPCVAGVPLALEVGRGQYAGLPSLSLAACPGSYYFTHSAKLKVGRWAPKHNLVRPKSGRAACA
jgi:hypothetical protein